MRPLFVALAVSAGALLAPAARAADLGTWDDAPLHAVQFVDGDEGWAVGAEGVVWHTIDGGKNWERQPTGVRASLQSLHFLNPYVGWVAGREELPHGRGSVGVLLSTHDGGQRWRRVTLNALPGLNRVRFVDTTTGFAAGDGSEDVPTGLVKTTDGGKTWQPVPGPRCASWLAADFQDAQSGALAGAWSQLAALRQGNVIKVDIDQLGGRNLRALHLAGKRGVAVGQGGLVLLNENTDGLEWPIPDLGLPRSALAGWDFQAVDTLGNHIWAAGRPGSVLLHSGDFGGTWEVVRTGQPLPIQGLFFLDEHRGWAVGEYGTILGTTDGGKSWQVQHRGGQRAALLFLHARGGALPVETLALLGGDQGYLATALRVEAADPASAAPRRASEPQRFAAAVRQAGGAAGESLWQFPVPQHLARTGKLDLITAWDQVHGKHAADQLLRQTVLALRIWRPEVVVTDNPAPRGGDYPGDTLVAEAVKEAFVRAADPEAFPEQLKELGLEPWQAAKLYACWDGKTGAQVTVSANEPGTRLEATPREFATPAAALLVDVPPAVPGRRAFRLLASKDPEAVHHADLMEGTIFPPGGVARRNLGEVQEPPAEVVKAIQARRDLETLAETPVQGLTDPDKLLARIGPELAGLPPEHGAPAAFAVASQFARQGQWTLAREAFLLMVDRYPAHPLAADAYRWLINYNGSAEARRRHELGEFLVLTSDEFKARPKKDDDGEAKPGPDGKPRPPKYEVTVQETRHLQPLGTREDTRRWYQGALEIEPRLAAFGPLFATDPAVQFALQAARRSLGDFDTPKAYYAKFAAEHSSGPWHDVAATELWLTNRRGVPPRPVAYCRTTDARPFLDGKLDEDCWKAHRPIVLHNAVGDTVKEYPTEVWLAHDQEFLYLALRCKHPADKHVDPVKVRPHDADVRPYDRVSLLLDLDRDYSTYFQLQVDQRGCVCDDCWGDLTWNPRWFVAVHSEPDCWQVEAAIPLTELTGDAVSLGTTWACNVVRTLPGRGVQAFSTPADVQPRPEGMGLLLFMEEPRAPAAPERPARPMAKVP
jgi:photosystem II stability/assembly factor-like uncharacterized protein